MLFAYGKTVAWQVSSHGISSQFSDLLFASLIK